MFNCDPMRMCVKQSLRSQGNLFFFLIVFFFSFVFAISSFQNLVISQNILEFEYRILLWAVVLFLSLCFFLVTVADMNSVQTYTESLVCVRGLDARLTKIKTPGLAFKDFKLKQERQIYNTVSKILKSQEKVLLVTLGKGKNFYFCFLLDAPLFFILFIFLSLVLI